MEEITVEYREMVKKYCAFVNIKLDEALDGKSQLADIDIESMVRTANTLVVTSKRVAENQPKSRTVHLRFPRYSGYCC